MTTAIQIPPRPAIEYPDDDGKPMSERIIGRDGEPFITPLEMSRQRTAERNRAEAERNRAEAYAAKLRELGIEPD